MSRLTIDKYARKLGSIVENIASSREEEGSQSKITLNNFYDRYTSKLEEYSNDLNFETISPKYKVYRDDLLLIAKNLNSYLNFRKSAISNMSDAFSAYEAVKRYKEDYMEYQYELKTTEYSRDLYFNLSYRTLKEGLKESMDFLEKRIYYYNDINNLDSTFFAFDTLVINYNLRSENSKLVEHILIPSNFRDTINDWLISNKTTFLDLELPEFK